MKFTIEWLKQHLDTPVTDAQIIDELTKIGLEVEEVEDLAAKLGAFTIAHVISAEKHPNADKLRVLLVETGSGDPVKVVCGAPNARAGMKGVFAAAGTYIPGTDFVLTKGVIRGEESNGMLCSERELLISDDHDGIIELPEDAPIGMKYTEYAKINEVVIDIAITPNRGDCTGVYGIARDLAGAGLGELKDTPIMPIKGEGETPKIELRFDGAETVACPAFAGRLIKGVKNGPSPEWLQKRLIALGLRPISILVDITNFVTYDRGRPLHVFDANRLNGTLHARYGNQGESFEALDGKTYEVSEQDCVIADDSGVLGLGGIIGGTSTGSEMDTTDVLIECAWFDPITVANTGRRHGINTDARYRFERTADPAFILPGIELATKLVLELCGGTPCEVYLAGEIEIPEKIIDFPLAEIKRLTGLQVSFAEVRTILSRLGFWVAGTGDTVKVNVPSFRPDIEGKADLVEEIMRIVGVDKVPVEPLPPLSSVAQKVLTPIQVRRRTARRALAARGLNEAVTWSFISKDEAEMFGGGDASLSLANPISSMLTDMRPSLIPGLIAGTGRNVNRGFADVALFEVGQIFKNDTPEGQFTYATGIRRGTAKPTGGGRHWQGSAPAVDAFDAKADAFALLDALGQDPERFQIIQDAPDWAHPGRSGRIQLGPKMIIGWFGEVHPNVLKTLDVEGPMVAFEINLDALPVGKPKTKSKGALNLSDLMSLNRDFAFVVSSDTAAEKLIRAAKSADKKLITKVNLFDVYEGVHVGLGKKSLAIEVTLSPKNKTMTDEEIEAVSAKIVAAVTKATGGELRA